MSRARVTGIDHVVLGSHDVEASVAWYRDVLGLEPLRLEEWRAGEVLFPSMRVDAGTIIDILERDPVAPVDHVCLVIEPTDLEALAAEPLLRAQGEPMELFGARGTGWGIYVTDPAGNVIELRHYGSSAAGD